MLVEIIMGKKTGDEALATALDFVRAIKKTPIVVNDCRGFYANRCVGNYMLEGHLMLIEGVPPAMIENVGADGRHAGRAARRSTTRSRSISPGRSCKATEADLGAAAVDPRQEALLDAMVEKQGRLGRKNGKGFYDYPEKGPKTLWPGLADLQPTKLDPDTHRRRGAQAALPGRCRRWRPRACMEEGVVTDLREADVGSILGFGFAPFTGGTLSYIDMMGAKRFVALCRQLEEKYGPRFKPPKLLLDMAAEGRDASTAASRREGKAAVMRIA